MDPVTVPLVAIQITAVTIFVLDLLMLVFVLLFRAIEGLQGRLRAPALKEARMAMLQAAATGEGGSPDSDPPELKRSASNRVVMLAAAQLLSSLRGEAHGDLVRYLTRNGYAERAAGQLQSRSGLTRGVACELLGAIGSTDHSSDLVGLLGDRDADVRNSAIRAVGRLQNPNNVDDLLDSLRAERRAPPILVSVALLRIGPRAAERLRAGLKSSDATVRAVSARVLGLLNVFDAVDDLAAVLSRDDETLPRLEAAVALGRLGGDQAREPLQNCARADGDEQLRVAAVSALSGIADQAALETLRDLLGDADPRLARAAASSLERSGPAGRAILSLLPEDGRAAAYAAEVQAIGQLERDRRTGVTS